MNIETFWKKVNKVDILILSILWCIDNDFDKVIMNGCLHSYVAYKGDVSCPLFKDYFLKLQTWNRCHGIYNLSPSQTFGRQDVWGSGIWGNPKWVLEG